MFSKTVEIISAVEFIYCGCGCQKTRPKYKQTGEIARFIGQHYLQSLKQKGTSHPLYGKHHTQESRSKMSKSKMGNQVNLGRKHTQEAKLKMSKKAQGRNAGEKSYLWKVDNNISYDALHRRIRKRFPKTELCMLCKKVQPYHLACITGIYDMDLKNWAWFCVKCHIEWDNIVQRAWISKRLKKK